MCDQWVCSSDLQRLRPGRPSSCPHCRGRAPSSLFPAGRAVGRWKISVPPPPVVGERRGSGRPGCRGGALPAQRLPRAQRPERPGPAQASSVHAGWTLALAVLGKALNLPCCLCSLFLAALLSYRGQKTKLMLITRCETITAASRMSIVITSIFPCSLFCPCPLPGDERSVCRRYYTFPLPRISF